MVFLYVLGFNIKYGLSLSFLGIKVAYTSERVNVQTENGEVY